MISTLILQEKYRVQRKLAEQSGYDVRKHFEPCRKIVAETNWAGGFPDGSFKGKRKDLILGFFVLIFRKYAQIFWKIHQYSRMLWTGWIGGAG
uniref:Uncharacterized protein n=1 Tax=Candidatus Kentrum sp. FW TaxID=2126338 RepID=A0A450T5K3_9GAMM|nr:MAG: hypothetical protein BECKFW1821B_GA0114236_106715 [Candidatus Kentron sp. FW]